MWSRNALPMWRWRALLAACLMMPALARGGDDLTQLSLQDLLQVPVTSVSKRKQPLSRTAAAVYVITQEDIRRSVATCLPELLRMAPGLHVARIDANKWAVGARGFGGRYSDKLLVLVDGRSVYTQMFSGVYWESLDLPLEDIDRIEIIRGPGAAVWGANAVNGVINIITKPARDTRGALVSAQTGSSDRAVGTLRYGGALGRKFAYRTYVRGGLRAPYSNLSGQSAQDGWDSLQAGFRADGQSARGDRYMLQGEGYGMEADSRTVSLSRVKPYQSNSLGTLRMSGASGQFRWERPLSETSNLSLEGSFSGYSRDEGKTGIALSDRAASLDMQHGFRAGNRQQVTWGLGFRRSLSDFKSISVQALATGRTLDALSLFAEDEFELLREKLYLTVGAKLERHTYTGWGLQPRVQISVPFHKRQLAWMSAARALRTPSRYERDLLGADVSYLGEIFGMPAFASLAGNPNIQAEVVDALEAGYRLQASSSLSFDIALFVNRYRRLRVAVPGNPRLDGGPQGAALVVPVSMSDSGRGTEKGGELAVTWMPAPRWKLNASYSHATPHITGGSARAARGSDFAYPRNQASGRSFLDLPKRFSLDASYYYVSPVTVVLADGTRVPLAPGLRGDLRLARRFGNGLELMFCADHLFGPARVEYVPEAFSGGSRIGRSYHLRLLWRPRD
ncbi:MAG: TonB-dependent receptor [Bryobacterales bacterium]|nr:TonB-dependent receptor [Bryobacterales bacterium]